MRQGSRQPRGQETESEESAVDAAQAFEALQAEVALQRRAIEALGEALDGVLEVRTPLDLSPDIARIVQDQAQVVQHVEQLRLHPVRIPVNVNAHSGMVNADSGQRERCGGCGVMLRALIVF